MRTTTLLIAGAISSAFAITAAFAQSESNDGAEAATTKTCYPAKYTESGDLILPENFHEWVYVGSPLTPNALNGGQANFPEFHNVYIEPCSYEVRSEEHTSELQSLMRISYAVFCLKK